MARQAATRQTARKSQVRAKASKQVEPKAEAEVRKAAPAQPEQPAAAEPSKEQLEKARVESEKALKEFERQGAGDSTLTRYFREMIGHRVLTPQEEIQAAKEVERLEIAYWEALLSHPACFETVAAVIEKRVEDQTLPEVATLRRLCKTAKADKLGKRARPWTNARIAAGSHLGDVPVFSRTYFPWLDELESDWKLFRDEARAALAVRSAVAPLRRVSVDHERIAPGDAWRSFFLYGYGHRRDAACARCP